MRAIILRAKDVLDPRILVREGALDALWDGAKWQRITADEADALAETFLPVRGTNISRDIVMRARNALDVWD